MTAVELPEGDGLMRAYLRALPAVVALTAQRQYFKLPENPRPVLPCILLYRVGGAPDDKGHDHPDMIFECWGETKHDASMLAKALAEIIADSPNHPHVHVSEGVVLSGTVNSGPRESGGVSWAKRYRIDASFMVRRA